jgi:sodium-dependent dicarboxylate transporter 2/3/5
MNEKTAEKIPLKKIIGLVAGILIIVIGAMLTPPEGLSKPGLMSIVLMLAGVAMWVTEVLPLAATAFVLMCIMPFFHIFGIPGETVTNVETGALLTWNNAFNSVWGNFISSVFFFVLATFAMTAALVKSTIPSRICNLMLKWSGGRTRLLILLMGLATACLSAICSNTPVTALFASLSVSLLIANGNPTPGSSNLGKALMLMVPCAAQIGGMMTPAGTSINILIMEMIQKAGYQFRFLDWMAIGVPSALILTVISWIIIVTIFKPEAVKQEAITTVQAAIGNKPLAAYEVRMLFTIVLMFGFWIASTWHPALNTSAVALFGMAVFLAPGIGCITWKEFCDSTSWEVVMLIGAIQAMAGGISATGAANWIVATTMADAAAWSSLQVMLIVSLLCAVLHMIIPTGPAVAAVAIMPFLGLAATTGYNPISIAMIVAFWSATVYVFPFDAVPCLTFGYRYYSIIDMIKNGLPTTLICVFVAAIIIPFFTELFGFDGQAVGTAVLMLLE